MAIALQSTGHHYTVSTVLKSPKYIQDVQFAGAWQLDNLDGWWIVQAHRTGEVGCSISAIVATKGDDFRTEFLRGHSFS
jgi:hypothetical protein